MLIVGARQCVVVSGQAILLLYSPRAHGGRGSPLFSQMTKFMNLLLCQVVTDAAVISANIIIIHSKQACSSLLALAHGKM
ncbi:hypothetical protein BDF22DRAFT_663515 [Syncephalis plumigaleata]|nr:hypothetical protein BDF22DRAFT_663515 [Syncephalis plumigaleata]